MAPARGQQDSDLYLQGGFWKLRWQEKPADANGFVEPQWHEPAWIGPATGPLRLTEEQAQRIAWENFLSRLGQNAPGPQTGTTIADFVADRFVPEHVAGKTPSGRTHYQAILKHILTPEEVDRVFRVDAGKSKTKLRAVPDWPYLDGVRLCDVRQDDVERLISAALAHGYSAQTVKHIRNVVSAIFAHARRKQCFTGDNPASLVKLPAMTRKEAHALTLPQAIEVLGEMQYPEKEMTLIAIFTSMTVAEICGLQWKQVNLTEAWSDADGAKIPPGSIAVTKQWYRGKLGSVGKKSRNRNLPIPEALVPVLLGLSQRAEFTGPDDFVLVSQRGTAINERNVAARRLKPLGVALHMPWLSWQVLRRTHTILAYELGMQFLDRIATMGRSDPVTQKPPLTRGVSSAKPLTKAHSVGA